METVGSEGDEAQAPFSREGAERESGRKARRPTVSQSGGQHARREQEDFAQEDALSEEDDAKAREWIDGMCAVY